MARAFASTADVGPKRIVFEKLTPNAHVYSAEGDPTSGVVIGDDSVMVIDARATPAAAQDLIRRVRRVTRKPIQYVVLTHYHAVRVLGASAYGADHIIASEATRALIRERGAQDYKSEVGRFPRLFQGVETVPGRVRTGDRRYRGFHHRPLPRRRLTVLGGNRHRIRLDLGAK